MTIKILDTLQAAVDSAKAMNHRDLLKLHDAIGGLLRAQEQKHSAEYRRAALMEAAATDPAMRATLTYAVGRLRALGLDLKAAADKSKLDAALRERPTQDRMAIRAALARCGIID
jgi:hypothetical protein